MRKWWHTLVTIGGAAVSVSTPSLQHFAAAHPVLGILAMTAWAIIGAVLPSPLGRPWGNGL
jgi:hypothetical protein